MGKAGAVPVAAPQAADARPRNEGETVTSFFLSKINELELLIKDKSHNLRRLEAQRNELNTQGESERIEREGRAALWSVALVVARCRLCLAAAHPRKKTTPHFSRPSLPFSPL